MKKLGLQWMLIERCNRSYQVDDLRFVFQIWALSVDSQDRYFVSGGTDSCISVWTDLSKEFEENVNRKADEHVRHEHELSILLKEDQLSKVCFSCLRFRSIRRLLNLLSSYGYPASYSTVAH